MAMVRLRQENHVEVLKWRLIDSMMIEWTKEEVTAIEETWREGGSQWR